MDLVLVMKARWDQGLDRLAEQLLASIPEQLLCLRVDQDDLARRVDDDHGIRRRLQQSPEFLLCLRAQVLNFLLQCLLRSC